MAVNALRTVPGDKGSRGHFFCALVPRRDLRHPRLRQRGATHNAVPAAPDEQLLSDIDLSILGAPPDRFREYEAQVRKEYAWVPDALFHRERGKILQGFLARPSIYATELFRARLEAQARENLASSLG